ncbi:MAG: TetR/AcrR family transcriptional regulator [Clostridiales bacterium]|nr:TetR/AcrR family transcriptional regulator [Clostridiales bacterium]
MKKREAIINAARELFTERGIINVNISEIANKANVSQVTIYNYFGDKNALAKEAFVSYIEAAISKYVQIIDSELPFTEKLECIIQDKRDMVNEIVSSYFSEQIWEDKTLRLIFQDTLKEKAMSLYTKFLETGKKEGFIDKSIPNEAILDYFMASMQIYQRSDFIMTDSEYKLGIMKLFLYGLIGNPNK